MAKSSDFYNSDNSDRTWPRHVEQFSFPKKKFVSSLGKRPNKYQPIRLLPLSNCNLAEEVDVSDESDENKTYPHTYSGISADRAEKEDSLNIDKQRISKFFSNTSPIKICHNVKEDYRKYPVSRNLEKEEFGYRINKYSDVISNDLGTDKSGYRSNKHSDIVYKNLVTEKSGYPSNNYSNVISRSLGTEDSGYGSNNYSSSTFRKLGTNEFRYASNNYSEDISGNFVTEGSRYKAIKYPDVTSRVLGGKEFKGRTNKYSDVISRNLETEEYGYRSKKNSDIIYQNLVTEESGYTSIDYSDVISEKLGGIEFRDRSNKYSDVISKNLGIKESGYRNNKYSDVISEDLGTEESRFMSSKYSGVVYSAKTDQKIISENRNISMKLSHSAKAKLLPSIEYEHLSRDLAGVKKKSSSYARSLYFDTNRRTCIAQSSVATQTVTETSEKEVQACKIKVKTKDAVTTTENQPITRVHKPLEIKTLIVNGNRYQILKQIGSGGSSLVYQVFDQKNKSLKALKYVKLPLNDESVKASYINEVRLLRHLRNYDCVVRLYDFEYLPKEEILYLVLEQGDVDFSRLIKEAFQRKKFLLKSEIYHYWTEMLKAVKCIHDNGIIHSDLKPSNFLLVSGRLKLIDFGIASTVQSDVTSVVKDSAIGTFNYLSPESILNVCRPELGDKALYRIRYRSDVWSLGCILYLLVYGKTPFQHITNPFLKVAAIQDPNTKVNYPPSKTCTEVLRSTMKKCLMFDPEKRPTVAELLQIKYF